MQTEAKLRESTRAYRDELVALTRDLVRIASENVPPRGREKAIQLFIRKWLADIGVPADLIDITRVPGLTSHKLFFRGDGYERREYEDRPNLVACYEGGSSGRTLILSGHADTMPVGTAPWRHDPLGGKVIGNRLYGRGSFDMKGGIAAGMMTLKILRKAGWKPAGKVIFETVVDEEHAGANGTLANRLAGFNGDAVIIPEPSNLHLYHAHKGFRIAHLALKGKSGMSFAGETLPNPVEHIGLLIEGLKVFRAQRRRSAPTRPEYSHDPDPVPVFMNKLQAGEFSLNIPMQIPETCTVEVYWQTMPGETRRAVEREFLDFLNRWIDEHRDFKPFKVTHRFSHRWLPGTAISPESPIVKVIEDAGRAVLKRNIPVAGAPFPCDLFVFHHFNIPGVILGPCGAGGHGSDEYVEIDSLVKLTRMLVSTIIRFDELPLAGAGRGHSGRDGAAVGRRRSEGAASVR